MSTKPNLPLPPTFNNLQIFVPVGSVIAFAGNFGKSNESGVKNIEALGWMECDGRNLRAAEYPELFVVLGYKYGGKDDSFNIPKYSNSGTPEFAYIIKYTYSSL